LRIAVSMQLDRLSFSSPFRWQRWLAALLALVLVWSSIPAVAVAQTRDQTRPQTSIQPYLDGVADRITEFTLKNGMKFIVMERHQAPVVSFMTYVNVGAAEEEAGKTGAAHFLEHLAFKGTTRIGTTNYEAERPLLDRLDQLFEQIQAAKAAGQTEEVATLQQEFDQVQAEAAQYAKQNEYGQIVEQAGGVGLNATTSADATRYFYSFPANKLELWMSLESERFLEPVFREFYEEKDVILEERRTRTDNSPIGKMVEVFLETALEGHPYGRPVIGYEEDIRNLTRQDIQDLFEAHYTPDNIVMTVVGDVQPNRVKQLAEAYFGRYQARDRSPALDVPMLQQSGPKEVTLEFPSEPWYFEGYLRPGIDSPDNAVYDVIASLLVGGRTSRLYRSLVEQKQIALSVDFISNFPGNRFSNVVLMYALTAPGHTLDEIADAFAAEIELLKREPVSAQELDRVKTQTRAGVLQALASNQGMASLLAEYEAKTGSWRNLFDDLKTVEAITAQDVQRVAQDLFQPNKLTIGKLITANASPVSTPTPTP
jgi:predicted Zn-dependent peptidase